MLQGSDNILFFSFVIYATPILIGNCLILIWAIFNIFSLEAKNLKIRKYRSRYIKEVVTDSNLFSKSHSSS